MTASEARSRVSKGALHLDQVRPGWAWQIDPGTLDLGSECHCVLGQLYGLYTRGLVNLTRHQGAAYGFDATALDHDGTFIGRDTAYRQLQDAWIEVLADRLLPSSIEGQPAAVEVSKS